MKIVNVFIVDDSMFKAQRIYQGVHAAYGIAVVGIGTYEDLIKYNSSTAIDAVICNVSMYAPQTRGLVDLVVHKMKVPMVALVDDQKQANQSLIFDITDCCVKKLGIIDDSLLNEVVNKIRLAFNRINGYSPIDKLLSDTGGVGNLSGVIAIGASTGGTEATLNVLSKLPKKIPGIVVTQHMMDKFIGIYAQRLDGLCALDVKEACDNDIIRPGRVLIAPGDRHMAVKKTSDGYAVRCYKGPEVSGHCPSVDALFDSVATACGRNAIGIILTGMGEDGARGLKKMRDAGAFTIGQGPEGCCVYGMPQKAYEIGAVSVQRALTMIPGELMNHLKKR